MWKPGSSVILFATNWAKNLTGTISAVTSFGIFVQLDSLYIEGLVHVTELGADYFQYDEGAP